MPETPDIGLLQVLHDFGNALFGLLGVIFGGIIACLREGWIAWITRRRNGSYAAIRITCILEEYAGKCIDVVEDDGTEYGQPAGRTEDGEEYHVVQVTAPPPPDYPDDVDWRSLDEQIMHRVLALPNQARRTDRFIAAASKNASPPFYEESSNARQFFNARQKGYADLGLEALEVANELKRQYDISTTGCIVPNSDGDPEAFLRGRLAKLTGKEVS